MKTFLHHILRKKETSAGPWVEPVVADSSPNEKVSIRPMRTSDIERVRVIDELSFSLPWPASSYRFELVENRSSMLWVAEERPVEGELFVVGMTVVWMIVDEAHIATIAVHPDYRGRGIGQKLLGHSLEKAALEGARQATLEVRVSNLIAQNLYRKYGFQVVGQRQKYYQDNQEDALIMTTFDLMFDPQ